MFDSSSGKSVSAGIQECATTKFSESERERERERGNKISCRIMFVSNRRRAGWIGGMDGWMCVVVRWMDPPASNHVPPTARFFLQEQRRFDEALFQSRRLRKVGCAGSTRTTRRQLLKAGEDGAGGEGEGEEAIATGRGGGGGDGWVRRRRRRTTGSGGGGGCRVLEETEGRLAR